MMETIRGYHLALASVFNYSDCSVFDDPEIACSAEEFHS